MAGRPNSTRPPGSKGRALAVVSAQSARGPRPRARSSSVKSRRVLDELQDECTELKRLINKTSEDNLRARTRLMALDKELNKRERLLQTMVKLNQTGMGLGADLVEKLREERNMLPLYRRKAQDLQQQIEERESEQKAMKREPFFTRVIELQIEYVSWKQETSRLEALLTEPSPEANPGAQQEVDVFHRRLERLKEELSATLRRRDQVTEELTEIREDHGVAQRNFQEKQAFLTREQEATREVAVAFKQLLQDRKEAEKLQAEIREMDLARRQHDEELSSLMERQALEEAKRDRTAPAPAGPAPPKALSREAERGLALLKRALRREVGRSLSSILRSVDRDEDGLVSSAELEEALGQWQGCPLSSSEAASLLFSLCARAGEGSDRLRWPDVLDLVERSSDLPPQDEASLPGLAPLRWACLRSRMSAEELTHQIQAISSFAKARELFGGLGDSGLALPPQEGAKWIEVWQQLGTQQLLMKLPIEQASLSRDGFSSWSARLKGAITKNREDLTQSFSVWRADMMLSPEQFRLVCPEVLGPSITSEDVEDLLLLFCPAFPTDDKKEVIDGKLVLQQFST